MKLFHAWDTMDWPRISSIVAFVTVFWIGLVAIIPDKYHKIVSIVLGSLQSAITLMMRSGKSRPEKIDEKVEEIENLVVNEVKEKTQK